MSRLRLERIPIQRRDPRERVKDFFEVAPGYSAREAIAEAERCLDCIRPRCVASCPLANDIPGFIEAVGRGDFKEAARRIRKNNALPGVCGRVCSREGGCEASCILAKRGAPVAIKELERFVADSENAERAAAWGPIPPLRDGVPVAIVGAGPAGLAAATYLAKAGHGVTIFESEEVAGGLLTYGIPPYRLPKEVVAREVERVIALGVDIRLGWGVFSLEDLEGLWRSGFGAVLIATGASKPLLPGLPGEGLSGVYLASEFLYRLNRAYIRGEPLQPVGKVVTVIGGGNVAVDVARCALRLGASKVMVIYRRSEKEMPAQPQEVDEAREEGVEFVFQAGLQRFLGDGAHHLIGIECCRMELREPDEGGRRRPVPIPGSAFVIEADAAIAALGSVPHADFALSLGLELNDRGAVSVDPVTGRTTKPHVWAAGDIVVENGTVVQAMASARLAAADISAFLTAPKG